MAQIKTLSDRAQDERYRLVFRGLHALLIVACALLFARAPTGVLVDALATLPLLVASCSPSCRADSARRNPPR